MIASSIAIKVENLSKKYRLYDSPRDRLKESLHPLRKKYHHDFYALRDVSFEIKKGETVGIIGKNGSGKSTLLKILAGVLTPTGGNCHVYGAVSSLLELGTGFNPELTGVENVFFNGTLQGFSKAEMEAKLDDILSFADIGEYVYQPVKTYSSGMYVRLAFAVATAIDPEILIVDEALSVGDIFFQLKSMNKMKKLIEGGATLLFVSHDMYSIKQICERALFLEKGSMIYQGSSSTAADLYYKSFTSESNSILSYDESTGHLNNEESFENARGNSQFRKSMIKNELFENQALFLKFASTISRLRNGKAEFVNVQLLGEDGVVSNSFNYGERVTLRCIVRFYVEIALCNVSYFITTMQGLNIVFGDTRLINKLERVYEKDGMYIFEWSFHLNLVHGKYYTGCGLAVPPHDDVYEWEHLDLVRIACEFSVNPRKEGMIDGFVVWDNNLEIMKMEL